MSSNMRISVLSGRSGNSVKAWLRLIPGFRPEVIERVGSFFSDIAGGVHSGYLNIATNAVQATGTLSMSTFTSSNTLTVPTGVFGVGSSPNNHLATASTYAVLGDTAVTNSSIATSLTGDLGINTALGLTGFPPGTYTGTLNYNNGASSTAVADAYAAAIYYAGLPGYTDISAMDLGSATLTPGNYSYSSSATWTAGPLTFNALGNPNAVFVIKTGTTLVTPSAASVVLINGAQASNIYWIVGSSTTLGSASSIAGTIISGVSTSVGTTASVNGRLLAISGAVTFAGAASVTVPPVVPFTGSFAIGASDTITAANAAAAINAAGTCLISATSSGPVITITSTIPGTIGNFLPISMSGGGTASGPFLTGGSEDPCVKVYNGILPNGQTVTI